jgi:hypothetical protein
MIEYDPVFKAIACCKSVLQLDCIPRGIRHLTGYCGREKEMLEVVQVVQEKNDELLLQRKNDKNSQTRRNRKRQQQLPIIPKLVKDIKETFSSPLAVVNSLRNRFVDTQQPPLRPCKLLPSGSSKVYD